MQNEPIHPAVRVGHVHLRVADLDRALAFYRDGLGFTVTADARAIGIPMVLLAAGDYHHHIGLNTLESHGGTVAVYLDDPDGNGVELSYDRPRSEWFDAAGHPVLKADRFDYRELLADV